MQRIRIASVSNLPQGHGQRFASEWMESCQMNRWLLKNRLHEALAVHGPQTHWLETQVPQERPAPQRDLPPAPHWGHGDVGH